MGIPFGRDRIGVPKQHTARFLRKKRDETLRKMKRRLAREAKAEEIYRQTLAAIPYRSRW
jgi:hypothetical protein